MSSALPLLRQNKKAKSASQSKRGLRGFSLASLMCRPSLIRGPEDNAAAHKMSAPVDSLDIFVSHAWSDNGLWKQIALFFCCSPPIAYKATILLSTLEAWFLWDPRWFYPSRAYTAAVISLGFATFVLCTILFTVYRHRDTMVFFDKCCINQTDPAAKARDISRIPDYLQNSNKLIILWTPDYLNRLWCVYELAVFMRTHETKDVIVVNLGHIRLCMYVMAVQLLGMVSKWSLLQLSNTHESRISLFYNACQVIVSCILVTRGAQHCSEEWTTFRARLKSFDVSLAQCTLRDDYDRLTQLIREMYGSEVNFAASVRHLHFREEQDERAPMWFLSQTSWRIMSAPFVPAIAEAAISVFLIVFTVESKPLMKIVPYASALELPSTVTTLAWAIRTRLLPVLLQSFQVPLMLSLANKLAGQRLVLAGIQYTLAFMLFTWLSRASCGLGIFHIPVSEGTVQGPFHEASWLLVGLSTLWVIWSISKWSYSSRLPNIIS
ncbi:hypothetical protein FOL47_010170 [Perkinsus chesapeaki]|uniref:TIR domain-containing protein n=1 Tax=Perkinsus chesapeaki TaxID=330153 RepID=A0A7J6L456_PERCH|nr:hypothetical protein FOL47_010170 [Perkinsus chesapeaki]